MDNEIEPIYKKFNFPSNVQKLLKLVKSAGITATTNIYIYILLTRAGSDWKEGRMSRTNPHRPTQEGGYERDRAGAAAGRAGGW